MLISIIPLGCCSPPRARGARLTRPLPALATPCKVHFPRFAPLPTNASRLAVHLLFPPARRLASRLLGLSASKEVGAGRRQDPKPGNRTLPPGLASIASPAADAPPSSKCTSPPEL